MKGSTQARCDLENLMGKLLAGYRPRRVILFGSHVDGEPDRHSDIDILIVKETEMTPFQRRVEVGRIVRDRNRRTPIQPLVITPKELEAQVRKGDPFLIEILEKGEVLYDASGVQAAG